jgi:hypothetical protein
MSLKETMINQRLFNAAATAPSGHFLVNRKKLSDIAQTHLISLSLTQLRPREQNQPIFRKKKQEITRWFTILQPINSSR